MQRSEFVHQDVVLDIGQEEADLRYFFVLLADFGQVAADELEPKLPLFLELFLVLVEAELQKLRPHVQTHAQLFRFLAVHDVEVEDALKVLQALHVLDVVGQSDALVVVEEATGAGMEHLVVAC